MRFYFLFFTFLFLIVGTSIVSATTLSGSPGSLNFNLNIGEEKCLNFLVSSSDYSGNLNSIMEWAEKDSEVSSPNDFIFESSEVGLNVIYSPEIISNFDGEEEIQVCISGNEEGYWRGSLKYITESEGNTGIGVGTWLRVNITNIPNEETEEQISPANPNNNQNSGSGSSSSSKPTTNSNDTIINENTEANLNEKNSETPLGELEEPKEKSQGIFRTTGNAISDFSKTKTGKATGIIILAFILIFAGIKMYRKKFKK